MQFSLRNVVLLVVGGGVRVGSSRQDKGGRRLQLVLQRRLVWRAARQRRAVRAGRVDGLELRIEVSVCWGRSYDIDGWQMSRAE
jgi:hypothetical protein